MSNKKFFDITSYLTAVPVVVLMLSLVFGVGLAVLIHAFGTGTVTKIIFIIIGLIATVIYMGEQNNVAYEKRKALFTGIFFNIFSLLVLEGCLWYNSGYTERVPINAVVTDETMAVKSITGIYMKDMGVPYKKITYYNMDTNKVYGYRNIEPEDTEKLEILSSIKGIEYYINYVPFLVYESDSRYFRGSK